MSPNDIQTISEGWNVQRIYQCVVVLSRLIILVGISEHGDSWSCYTE